MADIEKWSNEKPQEAYNLRSQVYALMGNFPDALKEINKALEENYSVKNLFNRGMIRYSMKLYKTALEDFNAIVTDSLNFAEAYYFRGNCKFKLNDLDGACIDWNKTKELGKAIASKEIEYNCLKNMNSDQ